MKIWRKKDGHAPRDVPIGDVYVDDGDLYYEHISVDGPLDDRWRVRPMRWVLQQMDQNAPLGDHDKYYLVQSLGLDPDTELE